MEFYKYFEYRTAEIDFMLEEIVNRLINDKGLTNKGKDQLAKILNEYYGLKKSSEATY